MPVDGLLILDKPAGVTSRAVVEEIKKMLGAKSAGHVGTLDPGATGVLPILLGRATRVAQALERLDKEYVATVHIHKDVGDSELRSVLNEFTGVVKQLPPVKSAVMRRERERRIYSIDVLGRYGKNVQLRIVCEAGTYIRKLASDFGTRIGGAHLMALRRTRSGPFAESQAHAMKDIEHKDIREFVLPVESAVEHLPKVIVGDENVSRVMNGSPIGKEHISEPRALKAGLVAIFSQDGKFLALGKSTGATVAIKRVFAKA